MLEGIILLNQGIVFLYKVYNNSNIKKNGERGLYLPIYSKVHILN